MKGDSPKSDIAQVLTRHPNRSEARKLAGLLLTLLILLATPHCASASQIEPQPPPGFYQIASAPGVWMYQKDYQGGNPDYVQVVDLSLGARLAPLQAQIVQEGEGKGVYGGDQALFKRQSLNKFWNQLAASAPHAFCVANGLFFRLADDPTPLAFPLKVGGEYITDGFSVAEYAGEHLMLELWPGRADIRRLTRAAFQASSAPDIIGGLSEQANKRSKQYAGRTFAGVDDRDQDGIFETVLVFSTLTARQVDAAAVLRNFGADKIIMFDGGGSAQLICGEKTYIASERLIPQAIGVIAAERLPPTPTPTPAPSPTPTQAPASAGIGQKPARPVRSGLGGSPTARQAGDLLAAVIWIPAILLPVGLLVFFIAYRNRKLPER